MESHKIIMMHMSLPVQGFFGHVGQKEVVQHTVVNTEEIIASINQLFLFQLCDELNNPTVPNVKKWSSHQGSWRCVTSPAVRTVTLVCTVHCLLASAVHTSSVYGMRLWSYLLLYGICSH